MFVLRYPTQADPPALNVNFLDFHIEDVTDFQDSAMWNLCAVQQTILLHTDIDESAKVHNVADGAFKLHTGDEVFGFEHIRAQDGCRSVCARVSAGANQLLEHVFQCGHTAT